MKRIFQFPATAAAITFFTLASHAALAQVYDGRIEGKQILTPAAPPEPHITGAAVFGVRPAKPIRFRVSATGDRPIAYAAGGLPAGVKIDPATGWITGPAPEKPGDHTINLEARNAKGSSSRTLTLRVGETICLTPPMGWNSWYVHSEGVSEQAIREIATAMDEKRLTDHGWTYVNIDDCWMGLRDHATRAIQPNNKFSDMKAMVDFVNSKGLKVGLYSTPWMATYAGYIGGSAPNERLDYSSFYLPENERQNPQQLFGRYPNSIRKGLAQIGPVWLVDRDARQFAGWGVDYVKYDWKDWTLEQGAQGFTQRRDMPQIKTEATAKRVYDNFRGLDRDIVVSLSPDHNGEEEKFVPQYCNLWRLTPDIRAEWGRIMAPFTMEERLKLTRAGSYGDLDMLQIGPLGRPNRAEVVFTPSPLKPAEQYFQISLWCILTQPLLLSCNVPTMDAFDLNLVSNDEVLAVDQDSLCRQGYRVASARGNWEIWAKDLADGGKAVALFNLAATDQTLSFTRQQLGLAGSVRDLWRQKDLGPLGDQFSAQVSSHGVVFLKVKP